MLVDRAKMGGMDTLLEELDRRYVFDANGRMVESRFGGILPRFVLGRSVEGCLWRFRADVAADLVARIARLAAREPGFPIGAEGPIPAPERLVMIERLLSPIAFENEDEAGRDVPIESCRTVVTRESVVVAEFFTID